MALLRRCSFIVTALLGGVVLLLQSSGPLSGSEVSKRGALRADQPPLAAFLAGDQGHVAVQFLTKKYKGWFVAETTNFRFYHNQPHKLVQKIADIAERTRLTMAYKWFGEAPDDWDPKCQIFLHSNRAGYTLETKDGGKSEGCTLVRLDGLEVDSRRIHLHCDADNLLDEIVPHEVTHAVMGGNFGSHQTPRWADEGMAILSQPRDSIAHYQRLLRLFRSRHDLFSVDVLMQTEDIKEQNTLEFYCQSESLVEFLVTLRGPQVFTRFLWDSFKTNYEKALQKHYGIASFNDLDTQWRAYAFDQGLPPANFAWLPTRPGGSPVCEIGNH